MDATLACLVVFYITRGNVGPTVNRHGLYKCLEEVQDEYTDDRDATPLWCLCSTDLTKPLCPDDCPASAQSEGITVSKGLFLCFYLIFSNKIVFKLYRTFHRSGL